MPKHRTNDNAVWWVIGIVIVLFVINQMKHLPSATQEPYAACSTHYAQAPIGAKPWIPPVSMIPRLVTTPVNPPWRRLCMQCK